MMYSSDEDEYQSPAVIRQFGGRTKQDVMKRMQAQVAAAAAPAGAPGQVVRKQPDAPGPKPAAKRRRVTYSTADSEKGSVSRKINTLTEFKYTPVRDTLNLIQLQQGLDQVQVHVVPKSGGAGGDRTMDVRWSRPAVIAVSSILEMKVRRLLEVAVDTLDECSVTLGDRSIAKAMKILGESQSLRGMSGYDAEVTRKALQAAAAKSAKSPDGKPKVLTKAQRSKILEDIKQRKENDWQSSIKAANSPLGRAYTIFVPLVLDYLFKETGVQRASRESIRRILSHYALNILTNMIIRIHPILEHAKRCTVTVKDVDNAKDDTDRTAMLGFSSIVKKRVNIDRSIKATNAAAKRKLSTFQHMGTPVPPLFGAPGGMPPIPVAPQFVNLPPFGSPQQQGMLPGIASLLGGPQPVID